MKNLLKLSILAAILTAIPACNADGEFDAESLQRDLNAVADEGDRLADENPLLQPVAPEVRRGTGFIRLGAELIGLAGLILVGRKNAEKAKLLAEVDANPTTPPVADQASTPQAKTIARKLAG